MAYKHNKTWRKRHRKAFQDWKKRYYDEGRKNDENSGERLSNEEKLMIINKVASDRVLAIRLKRSIEAVQVARSMMINGRRSMPFLS